MMQTRFLETADLEVLGILFFGPWTRASEHHRSYKCRSSNPFLFSREGSDINCSPSHLEFSMLGFASLAVLSVLGLANGQSNIGFGPAFSLGPTQSWIREAKTTLVLPEVPSAQADRLALWPGMGTSSGDLIQALAVSFSDPAA